MKTPFKTLFSLKTGYYLVSLLIMMFLVSLALAPLYTIREYRILAKVDSLSTEGLDTAYEQPDLVELVREESYLKALLEASSGDSIHLVIDLSDSTISLYIKGVRIHETRISSFRGDRLLSSLPAIQWEALFSHPLAIQDQQATIVKEPIVVREAPSSPEEAALNAWMPDTLIQNPAFVRFSAEHWLELILEQDHNPVIRDRWERFGFRTKIIAVRCREAMGHFVTFKKQFYHPTLSLKLPVDDLRAIYRALPREAYVVITI